MSERTRADFAARAFLTLAALLPYWRLLTFGVIYVTDDIFASDIYNGELPGRVLVGQLIRQGQWPVWTNQLCSGLPLAGAPADPLGLAAFSLLAPAPALDLLVIVLLLVAAHGAYGLARRFGADRTGAVLAGIAFAGSGYIACQLKHLAVVSTVVWLPVGLALIDRAFSGPDAEGADAERRATDDVHGLFGLVFANRCSRGFPQSAYICASGLRRVRAVPGRDQRRVNSAAGAAPLKLVGGVGISTMLGAVSGAVVLLPLSELGSISDRAAALGWSWSTRPAYWPANVLTFLLPYVHGDISDNTYTGSSLFWEDYGYVGLATVLLASTAAGSRAAAAARRIRHRDDARRVPAGARRRPRPSSASHTCSFPGMKLFRFPTRFLIVVELGLALLAAIGVTRLARSSRPALARAVPIATADRSWRSAPVRAVDLFDPSAAAESDGAGRATWLAAPASVQAIHDGQSAAADVHTPPPRAAPSRTFQRAHGWADITPYFELRDVLEPNTGGGFWNTPSADCYAGHRSTVVRRRVGGPQSRTVAGLAARVSSTSSRGLLRDTSRLLEGASGPMASPTCSAPTRSKERRSDSSAMTGARTSTASTAPRACGSCRRRAR